MWTTSFAACLLLAFCSGCFYSAPPAEPETRPADTVVAADPETSADGPEAGWPNWMGPHHDGISSETGWATDWPVEGLRRNWSREIGIGFSSLSIARNRLFTMGHVDGIEHVYCLDANTGQTLWKYSYPSELVDNLHEGGPCSTPTIDGDRIYTVGREGRLVCLDFTTGAILWERLLQRDLGVVMPEWGFSGSPYILGRQLILEAGRVVSYDKLTGKKEWQTSQHKAGYGSAAAFDHGGRTLLATLDCEGLRVTQAADGSPVDFFPWPSPYGTNSTTPIVAGDQIYISTGYNVGCGLFRLDDHQKLNLIYDNRDMRNHFNNSILLDGHLYGFDGNSNLGRVVGLTCMSLESGDVAWRQQDMGCGSLMIVDGKLLILSESGELILAEATPEHYRELARSPFLEGRCWTVPVLFGRRVFGRNAAGLLVCARLPS